MNLFFLNKVLFYVIEINNRKLCGVCEIENEEMYGVNYCIECNEVMCEMCIRYYRKIVVICNYMVFLLDNVLDICR